MQNGAMTPDNEPAGERSCRQLTLNRGDALTNLHFDPAEKTPVTIRNVIVIYNPRAGTLLAMGGDPEHTLRQLFEARGIHAALHAFDKHRLNGIFERVDTASVDAVVVCGGDGSILAVVTAIGTRKIPLGLLPGGTMNILARDLGLPQELEAAADVILGGRTRAIDVAYVNEHPFLCNSAIGLMPHLARTREKLREVSWWRKWPTVLRQAIRLIRTYPRLHVKIATGHETRHFRTRAIAISNNPLLDAQGPIPPRETLDAGKLGIYIARDTSRWAVVRLAARMMAGTWQQDETVACLSIESAVLSLDRPRLLSVMNDGEPTQLYTPLHYSIRPRALHVLVA